MVNTFVRRLDATVSNAFHGDNLYSFSRIVCLVVALLFFLNQVLGMFDGFVKPDVIGQYGDFVGGVVGTILSVVLLSETFKSQIKEAQNNAQIFETQQLNEMVFHLLNQYNSVVSEFTVVDKDDQGITYKGKEALHYILVCMQAEFDKPNVAHSYRAALSTFENFCDMNTDFVPIYFRTVYHIFDVINRASVNTEVKVKYVKLVRCQFTDTELVFLRYNAMGNLGRNMQKLIVKYNLLKHIHPLDLLEFYRYRRMFVQVDRNKVNTILYMVRKKVHELFLSNNSSTEAITSLRTKYNINVSKNAEATICKFDLTRNRNVVLQHDLFTSLDLVGIDDIKKLFTDWFYELFDYSNFTEFKSRVIIIGSSVDRHDNKEHFSLTIKRRDNTKL